VPKDMTMLLQELKAARQQLEFSEAMQCEASRDTEQAHAELEEVTYARVYLSVCIENPAEGLDGGREASGCADSGGLCSLQVKMVLIEKQQRLSILTQEVRKCTLFLSRIRNLSLDVYVCVTYIHVCVCMCC
jgi:hypothetical protein